jgi:hypothetical protein
MSKQVKETRGRKPIWNEPAKHTKGYLIPVSKLSDFDIYAKKKIAEWLKAQNKTKHDGK